MALRTIINEKSKKRMKLLITESQFKSLIDNLNLIQEQNNSKKSIPLKYKKNN